MLPVKATIVSCGNRTDLPRALRRHAWIELGPDMRHRDDGQFEEMFVVACIRCGADVQLSADKVARLYVKALLKSIATGQDLVAVLNELSWARLTGASGSDRL